ncbi:ParB/Srx family N-terminal domain-containing protein [Microvirga sp. P5_D2]
MQHLSIIYQSTGSLSSYRNNPRVHSKAQVEQIRRSIEAHGFANPILVDETNTIIAGHGHLLAAKALGLPEVPTIQVAGLSEAARAALRIADNKIALNSAWDIDLLKVELQIISELEVGFDLKLTGFSPGEIDVTLEGGDEPEDEQVPATPMVPVSLECLERRVRQRH